MKHLSSILPVLIAGGLSLASAFACLADTETTTVKTTTITTGEPLSLSAGVSYQVVDPFTGRTMGVYDAGHKSVNFALSPGLVIVDDSSNKVVATFDSAGNAISLSSAPVLDPLIVSIDNRRADFDRTIRQIKVRGNVDEATIAALTTTLERINAQEEAYKNAGRPLTYAEQLSLGVQLNDLGDRIVPFSSTTTITPVIATRFVTTDGQIVLVDPFSSRNLRMQRQIDAEYAAGRMTNNQVARLKEELNDISSLQARSTKNGHVRESKQRFLTEKMDRVQTDMDNDVASTNEKRARIGIKVN